VTLWTSKQCLRGGKAVWVLLPRIRLSLLARVCWFAFFLFYDFSSTPDFPPAYVGFFSAYLADR
jgi:hypothetical protein